MDETAGIRVLLVEADEALRASTGEALRTRGHVAVAAATVAAALEELRRSEFDVAVVGPTLPDGRASDLLERIAEDGVCTESVLLATPARAEELQALVARAATTSRLRRENAHMHRRLEAHGAAEVIVTEDAAMREVLSTLDRLADSEAPVLIQGEGGTGRALLARALHRLSPRRLRPFVAADLGAVPPSLLESELFGHEKGAFAGAGARRPGLFEAADGGVLFLREVCDVPPPLQVKLLHALEAREVLRAGGTRPVRADVRLLSATSRNVKAEMQEGRLREDLYERLRGATVRLPPLRERKSDVPLLARRFLERCAPRKKLTPRALDALQAYAWPGNVRELRMIVERAVLLASSDTLDVHDLPPDVRDPGWRASPVRTGLSLAEMEREYIVTVLRLNDGHRGKTARALGIDPKTLYNKLGPERPRAKKPG
jgi:DNA-binding NtrC family response regulator